MKVNKLAVMAGIGLALCLGANNSLAQDNNNGGQGGGRGFRGGGGGNFDPAQFRERMMDNLRERLEVKDDAEWKTIQPKIEKVMDARQQMMSETIRGFMGGRNRDRGGDNNGGGDNGGRRGRGGPFGGGEPSAEAEALQKAIDSKAPTADVKAALAKLQEARKAKQADLEKAQADLRAVLTARQEAVATLSGLL